LSLWNGDPFLVVEEVKLLPVDLDAPAPQQDVQAAIAETSAERGPR
jgi:hypothetical protein